MELRFEVVELLVGVDQVSLELGHEFVFYLRADFLNVLGQALLIFDTLLDFLLELLLQLLDHLVELGINHF